MQGSVRYDDWCDFEGMEKVERKMCKRMKVKRKKEDLEEYGKAKPKRR